MILQKDTKNFYLKDKRALQQIETISKYYIKYSKEFDILWDDILLNESIEAHLDFDGKYAGSGTLDYQESKVLYLFIRHYKPNLILEIGTAQGVSSSVMAYAIQANKHGSITTVDIKPAHRPSKSFSNFVQQGIINIVIQDAITYITKYKLQEPDILFLDADHTKPFCDTIISLFKNKFKKTKYIYHEWALSINSTTPEIDYVSRTEWLFKFHERSSFERLMPNKKHFGFYGSCGLGVCI